VLTRDDPGKEKLEGEDLGRSDSMPDGKSFANTMEVPNTSLRVSKLPSRDKNRFSHSSQWISFRSKPPFPNTRASDERLANMDTHVSLIR